MSPRLLRTSLVILNASWHHGFVGSMPVLQSCCLLATVQPASTLLPGLPCLRLALITQESAWPMLRPLLVPLSVQSPMQPHVQACPHLPSLAQAAHKYVCTGPGEIKFSSWCTLAIFAHPCLASNCPQNPCAVEPASGEPGPGCTLTVQPRPPKIVLFPRVHTLLVLHTLAPLAPSCHPDHLCRLVQVWRVYWLMLACHLSRTLARSCCLSHGVCTLYWLEGCKTYRPLVQ